MKKSSMLGIALLVSLSPVSFAQQANSPQTFIGVIEMQCRNLTRQLTKSSVIQSALADRPIDEAAACSCAVSKLRATPKLAPFLDATPEELRTRLPRREQTATLMSYAMSAMIGCVAAQMESTLDPAQLE